MSRNPYLAASRPASSFTRSSRTSKRNDLSSNKGSLLSRSRSSATVSGLSGQMGAGNSYSSAAGYTPTWQRSLSSTRLNRYANDPSISNSTNKASEYTASSQRPTERISSYDSSRPSLYRSSSSQDINNVADRDNDGIDVRSVLFRVLITYKFYSNMRIVLTLSLLNPIFYTCSIWKTTNKASSNNLT